MELVRQYAEPQSMEHTYDHVTNVLILSNVTLYFHLQYTRPLHHNKLYPEVSGLAA
jgi:hypothetical protein